ncbi:WAP four-disulfide core domain protein 12, partial [Ophiophagus hannah]
YPIQQKPGVCPINDCNCVQPEDDKCQTDSDCEEKKKCCYYCCSMNCKVPLNRSQGFVQSIAADVLVLSLMSAGQIMIVKKRRNVVTLVVQCAVWTQNKKLQDS